MSNRGQQRHGKASLLLSGLGFYTLSMERRKKLGTILAGSLAAHAVALAIFGGWVVMRSGRETPAMFEATPPPRTYEPRQLEHRVKIQNQQRSSSRPAMLPRVVALKTSELALPEIKMDPKMVQTTFQPKFKAVAGRGLGAGLGTGYGTHGFGSGVSSVDFFGIRARGERIAILLDVSVSMVEDERGGPQGYMRVKQRVEEVINAISEISMFNVVAFADAAAVFQPAMVVANNENKKAAKLFLRPFNTKGNWGLAQGNVQPSRRGVKAGGGTTRLDLALTAAFEQHADTILVISDGIPRVKVVWSSEQWEAFEEEQRRWREHNASRVAAWQRANTAHQSSGDVVTRRVWVPPTKASPDTGLKEGTSNKGQSSRDGYWKTVTSRSGGGGAPPPGPRPEPPEADPGWWTLADFVRHLSMQYEHEYVPRGQPQPVIHCIGYQIDADGNAFLRGLARQYQGQYRRVQRLR